MMPSLKVVFVNFLIVWSAVMSAVWLLWQVLQHSVMQRQSGIDSCAERYHQLSAAQHTARVEHKFRLMNDKWEQMMTQLRLCADRWCLKLVISASVTDGFNDKFKFVNQVVKSVKLPLVTCGLDSDLWYDGRPISSWRNVIILLIFKILNYVQNLYFGFFYILKN